MPLPLASVRPARPVRGLARVPAVVVAVGVTGVLGFLGFLAAPSASAAPAASDASATDDAIRRYDVVVDLAPDGVAQVTLEMDADLGTEPGRGPYLTYLVKQRFDDTRDRIYRMRDFEASSATAPDEVHLDEDGGWLTVMVGDEDRDDVVGVHTYALTYTVDGLVNTAAAFDLADDQLYLNVIGDRWQIPLENLSVTIRGPADVTDTRCYTGTDGVCASTGIEQGAAVFTHDALEVGEPWTVAVAFPAGTFPGVEPILQERWALGRAFALTPLTGGLAALVTVLGLGGVVRHLRRTGRDEQYVGVTPGLLPAPGQDTTTAPRGPDAGAVRFTPPKGLRPGVVGTLIDERAESRDVTATLVDLAVRGYLTVRHGATAEDADDDVGSPAGPAGPAGPAERTAEDRDVTTEVDDDDWVLDRTGHDPDGTELLPFERTLLDGVFTDGSTARLADLGDTLAETFATVQAELYDDVMARRWFRGHPDRARNRWALRGFLVLVTGVVVTFVLALLTSWALLGLPLVVVGVVMLATTGAAPARTAAGSAVQVQAEGFRRYLTTAEADQLRFEDEAGAPDLFSRYLPFAIAFGVAERWARVVSEAAAAGRPVADPAWYTGTTAVWATGAFGADVARFTDAVGTAVSSSAVSTAGATGSSGFSGGSAGGGVSGGGGGTW